MARKPDDPHECCHQIQRALLDLTNFPHNDAPTEFCRLVEILADDDTPGADERWERAKRALGIFAAYAKNAATDQVYGIDQALELAKGGSGDDGPGAELKSVGSGGAA